MWFLRYASKQTKSQTDRQPDILIAIFRIKCLCTSCGDSGARAGAVAQVHLVAGDVPVHRTVHGLRRGDWPQQLGPAAGLRRRRHAAGAREHAVRARVVADHRYLRRTNRRGRPRAVRRTPQGKFFFYTGWT